MASPFQVDAYGYANKDLGKLGVPSSNDVLSDPGHAVRGYGEEYEGMGPYQPHLNQGVGEEPLEDGGQLAADRTYGNNGTTHIWKGVPSAKAL